MAELAPIPEDVQQAVDRIQPGAQVHLLAFSDLAPDGSFGEQWIALAGERVLVFSSNGEPSIAVSTRNRECEGYLNCRCAAKTTWVRSSYSIPTRCLLDNSWIVT